MIVRLFVAVLLLHHIEGVCKPWSWIANASRAAAQRLADGIAGRDTAQATARAQAASTSATERAIEAGHRRQKRPAFSPLADRDTSRPAPPRRRPEAHVIESTTVPRQSVEEQVRRYRKDTA